MSYTNDIIASDRSEDYKQKFINFNFVDTALVNK